MTRLADTARFLVATAPVVATVTQALGYQFAWRDDVLEHPLALLVLRSDGRLAASLPALRADPDAVRAALRPDAPGLFARVEQLCRGGASAAALRGALAVAGGATLTALVAGILLLRRRERRA